ncbi:hypothetical protein [Reichenbachiella versicolor]|uniref:hypothetical protein n=1 Tax=Reichenbachiella versicolor TaxID=1821036 RepID=UPI000D6DF956|nr:hypothetical protein [Reichenbachiella versicolor]
MKISTLFFLISQLAFLSSTAKDHKLTPSKHSDKWINGNEWSIERNNGITVKSYFDKYKSGKLIFNLEIENQSGQDFNIDPDEIFYVTTSFDTTLIRENYKDEVGSARSNSISKQKFFNEIYQKYDTIDIEKADKLIKNMKFLTGLGFLFDSDNLAITRGYSKIDFYKQNLLLKNTIEPNTTFRRLLIIDGSRYSDEIEIIIPLGNETFRIPYKKYRTNEE